MQVRFKKTGEKPQEAGAEKATMQEVTVDKAALRIRKARTINRFHNHKQDTQSPASPSTSFESQFRKTSEYTKQHS